MRVYVRVKPLDGIILPQASTTSDDAQFRLALRASTPNDAQNCINVSQDSVRSDLPISVELLTEKEPLTYHFDGIFVPGATQEDVFSEIKPFV